MSRKTLTMLVFFILFYFFHLSSVAGYSRAQQDIPHVHKRGTRGGYQGHLEQFCAGLTEVLWCSLYRWITANLTAAWLLFFQPGVHSLYCFIFSFPLSIQDTQLFLQFCTCHRTSVLAVEWKKRRGRGVCFFVTNQCANKIVVKKNWVLCEWCTEGPIGPNGEDFMWFVSD